MSGASDFPEYIDPSNDEDETLVELLDRVLDVGIVATGDLRISVADVDLIYVGLKLVVASVDRIEAGGAMERSFVPNVSEARS
ncbi:MAG: gas vesicle protein [Pseudomonadota bacterium]